jgi:hypothetical protein
VRGRCEGAALAPGTRVQVRLVDADATTRRIGFRLEDDQGTAP